MMEEGKIFQTRKGDKVRSRDEQKVANYLYNNGVEFVYEKPLRFDGSKPIYPDFYLPAYNVYIEVWGMHKKDYEYDKRMRWKKARYLKYHVRLIDLWAGSCMDNYEYFIRKNFEEIVGLPFPVKEKYRITVRPYSPGSKPVVKK